MDKFVVERYDQAPIQTQIYPRYNVSILSIVLSVRINWSFSQQDNSPNAILLQSSGAFLRSDVAKVEIIRHLTNEYCKNWRKMFIFAELKVKGA